MRAGGVAALLTEEGIPSPDAGRTRTDNGIKHQVSGAWNTSTINNIARNPLLLAICQHGVRSMGDKARFTPAGPREMEERDYRSDDKPKVIRNPEVNLVVAPARFEALVDPERHEKLISELDQRGRSQRGKPRSKDPTKNPLGTRVYDMNCTWPMYREPYNGKFRYKCGLYQQSHGAKCDHNHVDGLTATRFVLSCVRQRLLSQTLLPKLERRLTALAEHDMAATQPTHQLEERRSALAQVTRDLERAGRNLALAETESQHKVIAAVFDQLEEQRTSLQTEITSLESSAPASGDPETEVEAALQLVQQLTELARDKDNLKTACEVIRLANVHLFLGFQPVKLKKRMVNRITGGVVTFGAAPAPINMYHGATSRKMVKNSALPRPSVGGHGSPGKVGDVSTGREGNSLGNASRGDWI